MTITLPDEMRVGLEARAKAAGYESVDELVEDSLLAEDPTGLGTPDWIEANRNALLALAEQGRKSPPIENPKVFLAELIRRTDAGLPIGDMLP